MRTFWKALLVCVVLSILHTCDIHAEQRLVISVPEIPSKLSILESSHPAAIFARRALLAPLVSSDERGKFRMRIARSFQLAGDGASWMFDLDPRATFVSGESVGGASVRLSLERCSRLGRLPDVESVQVSYEAAQRTRVIVKLASRPSPEGASALGRAIADCPILEATSLDVFGSSVGEGTNVVGAGPFRTLAFREGRSLTLSRVPREGQERGGPQEIEILGYSQANQALSSLRSGSLDVLVTSDAEVLEVGSNDTTLTRIPCGEYSALVRRGLKFSCSHDFSFVEARYLS